MKPAKMISNREVFGKNPKNFQPFRRNSAYGKKGLSPEQFILRSLSNWPKLLPEAKQTLKIQTDSVVNSPIYDLLQKVEVSQLETSITTSLNGDL